MKIKTWYDPASLSSGNDTQRLAAAVWTELELASGLSPYGPVITGSIPIAISTEKSDLDICCCATDLMELRSAIETHLSGKVALIINLKLIRGIPSLVCKFVYKNLPVEIFGQSIPSTEQWAFRHMVVEKRLLELGRPKLGEDVVGLKTKGENTESAFAKALGLDGDAFASVLALEKLSDYELLLLLKKVGY